LLRQRAGDLRKRHDQLEKLEESDLLGQRAYAKQQAGEKLTPGEQRAAQNFIKRQQAIDALSAQIDYIDYNEALPPQGETPPSAPGGDVDFNWTPGGGIQPVDGGQAGAATTPVPAGGVIPPGAGAVRSPSIGRQIATGILGNAAGTALGHAGSAISSAVGGFHNPYRAPAPMTNSITPPAMDPRRIAAQQAMLRNMTPGPRQSGMIAPNYFTNPPISVDYTTPDYSTGMSYEDNVPYDPVTGRPTYAQ
jgi:hypothetical protein